MLMFSWPGDCCSSDNALKSSHAAVVCKMQELLDLLKRLGIHHPCFSSVPSEMSKGIFESMSVQLLWEKSESLQAGPEMRCLFHRHELQPVTTVHAALAHYVALRTPAHGPVRPL